MPYTYFIDGYNVLHRSSLLEPLMARDFEAARDALVEEISRFCAATGERATLVFDGRGRRPAKEEPLRGAPGFNVLYASKQHSADTLIERAVYTAKDRKSIIVVSGDRGIRDLCTGLGAMVMGPDNFLAVARGAADDISSTVATTYQARGDNSVEDRLSAAALEHLRGLKQRLEGRSQRAKKSRPKE